MMESKGTEVPKGTAYEPGAQVKKAKEKGVASSEKIVKNIL